MSWPNMTRSDFCALQKQVERLSKIRGNFLTFLEKNFCVSNSTYLDPNITCMYITIVFLQDYFLSIHISVILFDDQAEHTAIDPYLANWLSTFV